MLAKELLNINFIPLQPSSKISDALAIMDAWQTSSVPVVEPTTRKNVGHIRLEDVASQTDVSAPVSSLELRNPVYTFEDHHIFEVARQMLQHDVRILSVVDHSETYVGIIEQKKVLEALSQMLNIAAEGSVLTVEMKREDFMLAELVHLIETEGARILGLTVEHPDGNAMLVEVSLKLNVKEPSRIALSLQRYGYTISTQNKNDFIQLDFASRAEELLRYLDV